MLDRYLHPDPVRLRELAARDQIGPYLYVRGLRNAWIAATASTLLLFIWRHVKGCGRWFRFDTQHRRSV